MGGASLLPTMMGVLMQCSGGLDTGNVLAPAEDSDAADTDDTAHAQRDAQLATDRDALRKLYEAELTRIHSRPILEQPVEDFETLFTLYCQSGGGSVESCTCAWPVLVSVSQSSAVPYLASRSEGDDVFTRLPRDDFYAGLDGLGAFSDLRGICD